MHPAGFETAISAVEWPRTPEKELPVSNENGTEWATYPVWKSGEEKNVFPLLAYFLVTIPTELSRLH